MPECDPKISDEFVARLTNSLGPALELQNVARRKLLDSSAGSDDPGEEDVDVQLNPRDVARQLDGQLRQWLMKQ